jgi:hypothetical protein
MRVSCQRPNGPPPNNFGYEHTWRPGIAELLAYNHRPTGSTRRTVPSYVDGNAWTYVTVHADADELLPTRGNGEGECRWIPVEKVASLPLHPGLAASWDRLQTASQRCT